MYKDHDVALALSTQWRLFQYETRNAAKVRFCNPWVIRDDDIADCLSVNNEVCRRAYLQTPHRVASDLYCDWS